MSYAHLVEYVFVEKGSFDMKKALTLKRWKKEEPPERECLSDEDSDEDISNYEEIVIPKKRQEKIKLKASKAASSKLIKPIPKPQCTQKKLVPRVIPYNHVPTKSSPGHH